MTRPKPAGLPKMLCQSLIPGTGTLANATICRFCGYAPFLEGGNPGPLRKLFFESAAVRHPPIKPYRQCARARKESNSAIVDCGGEGGWCSVPAGRLFVPVWGNGHPQGVPLRNCGSFEVLNLDFLGPFSGLPQVIGSLHTEPCLWRGAKCPGEAN